MPSLLYKTGVNLLLGAYVALCAATIAAVAIPGRPVHVIADEIIDEHEMVHPVPARRTPPCWMCEDRIRQGY